MGHVVLELSQHSGLVVSKFVLSITIPHHEFQIMNYSCASIINTLPLPATADTIMEYINQNE